MKNKAITAILLILMLGSVTSTAYATSTDSLAKYLKKNPKP